MRRTFLIFSALQFLSLMHFNASAETELSDLDTPAVSALAEDLSTDLHETPSTDRARADELLRATRGLSTPDAILLLTDRLRGTPYRAGALGEGTPDAVDPDPPFRFDVLDCTTYVETVLALATTHDFPGFLAKMQAIRYTRKPGAPPTFENRNHFIEYSWIANVQSRGLLKDDTDHVAGKTPPTAFRGRIHLARFFQHAFSVALKLPSEGARARAIRAGADKYRAPGECGTAEAGACPEVSLPGILVTDAVRKPEVLSLIRTPAVVNWIRDRYFITSIDSTLLVSHQGFLIRKPGDPVVYLRHASSGSAHAVTEIPLLAYLGKLRAKDPRVVGMNIQRVVSERE